MRRIWGDLGRDWKFPDKCIRWYDLRMKNKPTKELKLDKDFIVDLIRTSLEELKKSDSNILNPTFEQENDLEQEKIGDRKLHEIAINHRFAVYIEDYLRCKGIKDYFVDIEFNRNGLLPKEHPTQRTPTGLPKQMRPDVIVHRRTDDDTQDRPRNLLVVEAKKGSSSELDMDKVKVFLSQENDYKYKFALTVSYLSTDGIVATLYDNEELKNPKIVNC